MERRPSEELDHKALEAWHVLKALVLLLLAGSPGPESTGVLPPGSMSSIPFQLHGSVSW